MERSIADLSRKESNKKKKQKANKNPDWSPEQMAIYDELLKICFENPQGFWNVESPQQEIVTLHDNGVTEKHIPSSRSDEKEIKK